MLSPSEGGDVTATYTHSTNSASDQPRTSGVNNCIAGNDSSPNQMYRYMATAPHGYTVSFPAFLQGSRCYTDASTVPDQVSLLPRKAEIGVFIVNTQIQPPQNIHIKVALQHSYYRIL